MFQVVVYACHGKEGVMFFRLFVTILFFVISPALAFSSNPAALFVFDGSGSMWGQVDGKAKITMAKEAMSGLVKDFPSGTDIGLISYGHRREGDCSDIETLASVGSDKASIIKAVNSINPKGKTPLTASIQIAAEQLKGRDAPTSIVVVSDGKESCNADPCAAAKAVREAGVNLKIHVIGFDVKKEEAEQLQCIAENGGGRYFSAANAAELAKSFAAVKKEVVEKKLVAKVIFRDDFNEDFLSEDWDVQNPDAEAMVLDEGKLILMAKAASLGKGNVPNFTVMNKEISPSHYVVTVKLHGDFSQEQYGSGSQYAGLLLYADPTNYLELWVQNDGSDATYGYTVNTIKAYFQKVAGGTFSKNENPAIIAWQREANYTTSMPFDVWLRIEKNKYKYSAFASRDGEKWISLGTIPFLGKKMKPALYADRNSNVPDSMVEFDWVEVNEMVKQ